MFALAYLDDIVVCSRSTAIHIDHVKHAQAISNDGRVTLRLKSLSFPLKDSITWATLFVGGA